MSTLLATLRLRHRPHPEQARSWSERAHSHLPEEKVRRLVFLAWEAAVEEASETPQGRQRLRALIAHHQRRSRVRPVLSIPAGLMGRWLAPARVWLAGKRGFSLIEVLTVLLILGVLTAIAVPTFLGETATAKDSNAKQELAVAYHEAKTTLVGASSYPSLGSNTDAPGAATLIGFLRGSEPQLTFRTDAVAPGNPNQVQVQRPDPNIVVYADSSVSGRVFCAESIETAEAAAANSTTPGLHWGSGTGAGACQALPVPVIVGGYQPRVLSFPALSGSAQQGQTLSVTAGSWSKAPSSYTYQWQDCLGSSCSPIAGATTSSYTLTAADVGYTVQAVITAANLGGSTTASSSTAAAVTPLPPVQQSAPAISGFSQVGQPLSVSVGAWSNNPSAYAYQWQLCNSSGGNCTPISGATSSTYTPVSSQATSTLRVLVSASNAGGASSATTALIPVSHVSGAAFPPETVLAGSFAAANSGNKIIVSTADASSGQSGPLMVRCSVPAPSSCLNYDPTKNQLYPAGNYSLGAPSTPVLNATQLADLKAQAQSAGTYYTSCPSSSTGRVVFIDSSTACTLPGGNSPSSYGILIDNGGAVTIGGNTSYYGIVYVTNPTLSTSTLFSESGTAVIYGAIFVDGPATVLAGESALNVQYDRKAFS